MRSRKLRHWNTYRFALALLIFAPAATIAEESANARSANTVTVSQRHGWCVAESPNFRCWTCQGPSESRALALACEVWRSRLQATWGSESAADAWTPRCEIIVHRTQSAYCSALARPGDASVGSTQIQFDGDRVVKRRIDLRSDAADWTAAALPHELSHVVLAERFQGRSLPPWADEGMAMLSESAAKREARLADLQAALQRRPTYHIRDLLSVRQLPPAHMRDAFYGQSLALTSWLVARSSPQGFSRFLEACHTKTVDDVLRQEFAVAGIEGLEREWRQWTQSPDAMDLVDLWRSDDAAELADLVNAD
jgi:hypothetical protein